jgi:hypothetical protein
MLWAHMLAYVTGTVKQELLLRNEYLGAENRILRGQRCFPSLNRRMNLLLNLKLGQGPLQSYRARLGHRLRQSEVPGPDRPFAFESDKCPRSGNKNNFCAFNFEATFWLGITESIVVAARP